MLLLAAVVAQGAPAPAVHDLGETGMKVSSDIPTATSHLPDPEPAEATEEERRLAALHTSDDEDKSENEDKPDADNQDQQAKDPRDDPATYPLTSKMSEPGKPKSVAEAELRYYKEKVAEVESAEDNKLTDAQLTEMAHTLMVLDKEGKDTKRERDIAHKLRSEGPSNLRVEVDPDHYKDAAAERARIKKVVADEHARQLAHDAFLKAEKIKEAERAEEMLKKYEADTMDSKLGSEIRAARKVVDEAQSHEDALESKVTAGDVDNVDEYGLRDKSTWGPPK
jgi:hypothetical protein